MRKVIELNANEWVEYEWGKALQHRLSGKCVKAIVWGQGVTFTGLAFPVFATEEGLSFGDEEAGEVVEIRNIKRVALES
jgi:hypothetical protein